jgi:hypothetical protein
MDLPCRVRLRPGSAAHAKASMSYRGLGRPGLLSARHRAHGQRTTKIQPYPLRAKCGQKRVPVSYTLYLSTEWKLSVFSVGFFSQQTSTFSSAAYAFRCLTSRSCKFRAKSEQLLRPIFFASTIFAEIWAFVGHSELLPRVQSAYL